MDSQQRFYLDALGIQLWERRAPGEEPASPLAAPAVEVAVADTAVAPGKPALAQTTEAEPAPTFEVTAPTSAHQTPAPSTDEDMPAWLDDGPPLDEPLFELEEREIDESSFVADTAVTALPDISTLDWPSLQRRVSECTRCPELLASRRQPLLGAGNQQAEVMIIGEAPDADEDQQGEPFVGRTGPLFNAMLHAVGFSRQQLYVTNVLKCYPPEHRAPKVDELASCEPFLQRQIALLQPKVILLMGRVAAQKLLQVDTPIGKLRGSVHHYEGTIPVVVTYHPGYLLRSPREKRHSWQDLCLLRSLLKA